MEHYVKQLENMIYDAKHRLSLQKVNYAIVPNHKNLILVEKYQSYYESLLDEHHAIIMKGEKK